MRRAGCRRLTFRHQIDPFFVEIRDAPVGDVFNVLHPCPLQERGGECAPDTAGAGDGQRPSDVPDLLWYLLAQPLIRNMYRPLDVPRFPLFWAARWKRAAKRRASLIKKRRVVRHWAAFRKRSHEPSAPSSASGRRSPPSTSKTSSDCFPTSRSLSTNSRAVRRYDGELVKASTAPLSSQTVSDAA